MRVVLVAGDLLPARTVRRRVDEPPFQMRSAPPEMICVDYALSWQNPRLLEIGTLFHEISSPYPNFGSLLLLISDATPGSTMRTSESGL
jgi:hypothetical protein